MPQNVTSSYRPRKYLTSLELLFYLNESQIELNIGYRGDVLSRASPKRKYSRSLQSYPAKSRVNTIYFRPKHANCTFWTLILYPEGHMGLVQCEPHFKKCSKAFTRDCDRWIIFIPTAHFLTDFSQIHPKTSFSNHLHWKALGLYVG